MSFKFWKFQYPEEPDPSPRGSRKRLLGNLLHRALPLEQTGIVNAARYRTRTLPAAGALLKEEDAEEKQITLEL